MVRQISTILGFGLGALWIVGLAGNSAPWLTWLDLLAAVCAFVIAGALDQRSPQGARVGSPIALSLGLFALWIIGLAAGSAPAWQIWWNFGFACAFLMTGVAATVDTTRYWGANNNYGYGTPSYGQRFGGFENYLYGRHTSPDYDYNRPGALLSGRGPRDYRRSDTRIEEDVYDRLTEQRQIDATDIRIEVKNGEVTLHGMVPSRRERRIAEDITDSVSGVRDVHNELQVGAAGNRSQVRAV